MSSRHGNELSKRLQEEYDRLLKSLAAGLDNNSYWRTVGQLQGLTDAMKISDEVDAELSGG